jgi:DNA-binding beta-propeller fold protein YncE
MVLSRTSSQVYRWENLHHYSFTSPLAIDAKGQWKLIYSAPPAEAPRLQFRWLADDSFRAGAHGDNDVFFASDEANQRVSMVSLSGRVAPFASGISNPSGLVIGPDKMFYVTNEANGGQLIRINNNGEKTIVAEKLGRPSSILFLDAKTALVSNRDGNIWKIALL